MSYDNEHLNRPMFRMIHRKRSLVVHWCEQNNVPITAIRIVMLHGVYGFGQGSPAYVIDWGD